MCTAATASCDRSMPSPYQTFCYSIISLDDKLHSPHSTHPDAKNELATQKEKKPTAAFTERAIFRVYASCQAVPANSPGPGCPKRDRTTCRTEVASRSCQSSFHLTDIYYRLCRPLLDRFYFETCHPFFSLLRLVLSYHIPRCHLTLLYTSSPATTLALNLPPLNSVSLLHHHPITILITLQL